MRDYAWGSVDGDDNAKAIFADRSYGAKAIGIMATFCFAALIVSAICYALTGDRIALAVEVAMAAGSAACSVQRDLYSTHTFIMIAETRTRNLEGRLDAIDLDMLTHRS